jgi:hypothetical protein
MSWLISGVSKPPLLLDTYSGAAAAYSLRSLSLAYGGSVVRVRRSSDNTEQDFTATQVTDGTLTTFCGAGNGFVRTIYDQSGNGLHLGQATTANQPGIVSSGALITEGGKVCLDFDGTNDQLNSASTIALPSPLASNVFSVFRATQGPEDGVFRTIYEAANISRIAFENDSLSGLAFISWDDTGTTIVTPSQHVNHVTTRQLLSVRYNGGGASIATNYVARRNATNLSITQGIADSSLGRTSGVSIGSRNNATQLTALRFQELIIYPSTQSANIAAIETNMNTHWAVY